jgi:hypothetical protein
MTNSTTFPGTVTASGFTGTSTNATNAVLATDATNASRPVIFGTATTGNVPLKTDPGLVYNPSSNKLTAGAFVGDGSELTGISAGFDPAVDIIAIGNGAGTTTQGANAIAIGHDAGSSGTQGAYAVALGWAAGQATQGDNAVAIGRQAGNNAQGTYAIAIGRQAGEVSQETRTVAIGDIAGSADQGANSVAVGFRAAFTGQRTYAVAIGSDAGSYNQGTLAVAVGSEAGKTSQGESTVAIGNDAGYLNQRAYAVAVGYRAGCSTQGTYAVAVGEEAGNSGQGTQSVAVGFAAGYNAQGSLCVAVGIGAGESNQGTAATAIGQFAGRTSQGNYSVALGGACGITNQATNAIAIGYGAAVTGQGQYAIALGRGAANYNQPANTFETWLASVRDTNGTEYLHIKNSGEIVRGNGYSDDRLKYDEKFITGAVKSLFKLRPQEYLKKPKLIPNPDHDEEWIHESGLMAQEVYYSAPEMRHLVTVADIAGDVDTLTPAPSDDPTQDPDYSVWGGKPSGIKYIQFIPYLIKGIQEIVTELPRSKTTVSNTWDQNITGLVVSAKMNTHKTNVTPIVSLSNVAMDKAWYGVVSDQKTDTNDYDTLVDTNGDTRIWVSDVGGSLESGDLVTTSNIAPGYAQKQSDDIIRNYTVGKVTQECDFTEPLQVSVKIPKKELSNVKYYVKNMIREVELSEYEVYNSRHTTVETKPMYICEVQKGEHKDAMRFYRGGVEVSAQPGEDIIEKHFLEKTPDKYELLDDKKKAKYTLSTLNIYKVHSQTRSTRLIPEHEEEVFIEEMADVLDGNGQIVWEETDETEPIYTLVNHGTHKAALLTCKLD